MDYRPDEFYVAVRGDQGFMTPITNDAAYDKRKLSVEEWAGKDGTLQNVNNDPKRGFKVKTTARRYRTDNVVWQIEHPQGFDFQISSENFCELVKNVKLDGGLIDEELLFMRVGSNNYLTWKDSELDKKTASVDVMQTKISVKDLKVGNEVLLKNGKTAIYHGAYHFLYLDNDTNLDSKSKRQHVLEYTGDHRNTDGKIMLDRVSTLNVVQILKSKGGEFPVDHEVLSEMVYKPDISKFYYKNNGNNIAVDHKPIVLRKMKSKLTEVETDKCTYYNNGVFMDGKNYETLQCVNIIHEQRYTSGGCDELVLDDGSIFPIPLITTSVNRGYYWSDREMKVHETSSIDITKVNQAYLATLERP